MDAYPISINMPVCLCMLTTRPYGADADLVGKFPSTTVPDFDVDLDSSPVDDVPGRHTEPLVDIGAALVAADVLLDDAEDEDSSEIEALDTSSTRSRRPTVTSTRQATGAEDAFQSYLRDIRGLGLLTHTEEIDLAQRAAAGDELARRKLIESNLRLVIAIARRYTSTGVPLIDLIQEVILGVMGTAEKFDYQRGC